MDVIGKKVENQVQFWSLLGPLLVLSSIAVLLFKISIHWYFPVCALIGIPLCMKWKMKGLVISLLSLFIFSALSYQNLELDERYWHVGLSLTLAFSFIVLALSLEEAEGIMSKLQLESQSRLNNFSLLDEKWKSAEQEWIIEREKNKNDVLSLSTEYAKTQEDKQTFYKLAQLAKDELIQFREQHQQLLQDLLYKKQNIAQLHERLEETELTIQDFVNSDAEKQLAVLNQQLSSLEIEAEYLKGKLVLAQTEELKGQQEKERLNQELQLIQEREKRYLVDQQYWQQNKIEQQNALQAFQNKYVILSQEKEMMAQAQQTLQQQLEQLRVAESQQKLIIEQAQRKIQELELRGFEKDQNIDNLQCIKREFEEQLVRQQEQATQQQYDYQQSLQQIENNYNDRFIQQANQSEKQALDYQMALQVLINEHNDHLIQKEAQLQQLKFQSQQALESCLKEQQDNLFQIENQFTQQVDQYETQLQQLENQLKIEKQQAEWQLIQVQEQFEQEAQQIKQAVEKEIADRQIQVQQRDDQLIQLAHDFKLEREDVLHLQQDMNCLNQELKHQTANNQKITQELRDLVQLKDQLEQEINHLKEQFQLTQAKVEVEVKSSPSVLTPTRRAESMYLQLKQQFQEKCQVLDATRRELFHTNEKLLQLCKQQEEEQLFGLAHNELILHQHLFELAQEYEQRHQQNQQEIEDLTQLVEHLVKK